MKKNKKTILALLAMIFTCGTHYAQDTGFDLSTQRSESQEILEVPGEKIDHKGLIINPTPHNIIIVEGKQLNISKGISLSDKKGAFADDLSFISLVKKGTPLTIDFGTDVAAKHGVKDVSGAYSLVINNKGISIIGYDEKGAFYGIQTLRQIIESPISSQNKLPLLEINDYPDMKYRGIVEGFYGTPWSHEVRKSLIDFYGKFKLNSYLYGPKDDHYHSSPHWRLPYPEAEAKNIHELVEVCNRNRVDFVWAIHPGKDIKWNEEDYQHLVKKFEMMYDLGVRSFAIFFDDIEGEGTNATMQTNLLNRLNKDFVEAKGDVSSLVLCPTDYTKIWADPSPEGSLPIYGKTLDSSVEIFWTGDVICSDLTKETMDWFNSRIQRPGYYWWNYPVTDYAQHIILQGPVYGLETSLTANDIVGFASNPMEHGEASKLALYSVADYTWNMADYNPIDSWERGLNEIAPSAKDAYRTFAIHSCDTETGYRRSESWETETFGIDNYTEQQFNNLLAEFEKVETVPAIMEKECDNALLLNELRPWLVEFGKLGTRGKKTLALIELSKTGTDEEFWNSYVQNLMTEEQRKDYNAHKSGTMKLQPFYENAMDDFAFSFYEKVSGEQPLGYKGVGSYPSLSTIASKLMFDNDSTTHFTTGDAQYTDSWIGADLLSQRDVTEIAIVQGRNSIDDVDYFDSTILEYSADGVQWNALTDTLNKQYIINWTGEPVKARYVRIRKLPSEKKSWSTVRTFKVNPLKVEDLAFAVEAADITKALYAFDKNPGTSYKNEGTLTFGLPANTKECILLANPMGEETTVKQLAADGTTLSIFNTNSAYIKFAVNPNAAKISVEGNLEIFEVIFQ